jgi:hypoxanthine phosphoribosyltransferase
LQGIREYYKSDSIVFDVFKQMSVIIPHVSVSHGMQPSEVKETMRWDDYLQRVEFLIKLIKRPMMEGRFIPDAIVGISNGGLIVADMVGRDAFQDKPILSLWANRRTMSKSNNWYFDNPYNQALCKAIISHASKSHPNDNIRIILVDDHFGTGNTVRQAVNYLRSQLGEKVKIVYFPLVTQRVDYLDAHIDIMPYNEEYSRIFHIGKDEFIRQVWTDARYFPYLNKGIEAKD